MSTLLQQFGMICINISHKVITLKSIRFNKKLQNSNKTNDLFLFMTPNSKPDGMNCHHFKPPPTCTCGGLKQLVNINESDRVMQFLMGLNESYATIRESILMMSLLLDTRKTHALVLQHERQTEIAARRDTHPVHHAM